MADETSSDRCYACGKRFRDQENRQGAFLEDDGHGTVAVGPDCFRKISTAGASGYKHPRGGPRLFVEYRFAVAAVSA